MSTVSAYWLNPEKTALQYSFQPHWTGDDYLGTVRQVHEVYLAGLSHQVRLIYDMRLSTYHVDFGLMRRFPELKQITTRSHLTPVVLVVGAPPALGAAMNIYTRGYQRSQRLRFMPDYESVLALLVEEGFLSQEQADHVLAVPPTPNITQAHPGEAASSADPPSQMTVF